MPNRRLLENNVDYRLLEDGVSFRLLENQISITLGNNLGVRTVAFASSFVATGGTGPYTYAVSSGLLPTGLTLNVNGNLTGTPTVSAAFPFYIVATDSLGQASIPILFTMYITDPAVVSSGVYKVVLNQTHDTLYSSLADPDNPTTANVAIPNPYIETYLVGDE